MPLRGEFLRPIVESAGRAVGAAAGRGELPLDWSARDCPALDQQGEPTAHTRLYLGSDGVMVPHVTDAEKRTRRERTKVKRRRCGRKRRALPKAKVGADGPFKEFKIVTFDDDAAEHRLVSVTRGDCRQAGRRMRRDAGRVGLDRADDKVGVVDGSDWIKNQIQRQSLPLDDVGLDFYHVAENLHKARRAVYGEEDPTDEQAAGNAWVGQVLHTAKHEGYEKLREQLQQCKSGLRGATRRQAAEQVLNYVTDRREMIQYPKFLEMGRQIGSGPTESMCKATTQRIKGRGCAGTGTTPKASWRWRRWSRAELGRTIGKRNSASPPDSRKICPTPTPPVPISPAAADNHANPSTPTVVNPSTPTVVYHDSLPLRHRHAGGVDLGLRSHWVACAAPARRHSPGRRVRHLHRQP